MIKSEVKNDAVAVHEFDLEHGMLARVSHPNIIKVPRNLSESVCDILIEYEYCRCSVLEKLPGDSSCWSGWAAAL